MGLLRPAPQALPLFEVNGALPQQVVGQPQQFNVVGVGGLLPVSLVFEQALPRVKVGRWEVFAHGRLRSKGFLN
ncbi:hypothetical protein D3C84_1148820 [compost metagenome]